MTIPNPWPPDRYEVRCERGYFGATEDRYHYAQFALEAAHALKAAGLASQVVVRRIADATVLYDHARGLELPAALW